MHCCESCAKGTSVRDALDPAGVNAKFAPTAHISLMWVCGHHDAATAKPVASAKSAWTVARQMEVRASTALADVSNYGWKL